MLLKEYTMAVMAKFYGIIEKAMKFVIINIIISKTEGRGYVQ